MSDLIDQVASNPLGRIAYRTLRPLVHLTRRLSHPGLPNNRQITKVAYRGRQFRLQHRRWNKSDLLAIDQCFRDLQYELPTGAHGALVEKVYSGILASGRQPLIVDCGANLGASVTWFSARYPEAHIVGIEPAPDNFDFLTHNCAGLDVDLRQAGIAPKAGRAWLHDTGDSAMGYRITSCPDKIAVDLVTMDDLLATKPASRYAPFLLKIDIEGAERDLFTGNEAVFNSFPLIIIEPHDWMFPGELSSLDFFRFHAAAGREFSMKRENVVSIAAQSGR
ncbi:FkbM family methyltransferase [Edaphobacter sp.]|uniref:FkbM family methyltransferase n=1 Tax=Edaphobacter sp. TaxID=1934404 RepID=UPI002DBE872C|nr:FkbM family methyltransferase [Edaphobacter sp.]HEU5342012.1 FkbM family methyltransferase [Edaphobacter sp.]